MGTATEPMRCSIFHTLMKELLLVIVAETMTLQHILKVILKKVLAMRFRAEFFCCLRASLPELLQAASFGREREILIDEYMVKNDSKAIVTLHSGRNMVNTAGACHQNSAAQSRKVKRMQGD